MVTEDTTELVMNNLGRINVDYRYLTKSTKYWLEIIEELIQAKIEIINSNIASLRSMSLDITSIAKELDTSRQNLYSGHNGVLKQYIEMRVKDMPTTPFQEIDKLREEKSLIETDKELLMVKDVKTEVLQYRLDEMAVRLDSAAKRHESDLNRISQLENELQKVQRELASLKSKQETNKQIIF